MSNFYIEYENSSGIQTQEFSTGALLKTFIANNKSTFINHCKVVAKLPEITDMINMFNGCSSLTSIDLSNFNTSNVTNMYYMFYNCSSLTSIDLSNFDTSNVTAMSGMFNGCSSLTSIDLSNFDTSNVTSMSIMFYNCSNLTTLYCNDDWSGGVVSYSNNMFDGCTSLVGAISYDSSKINIAYANPTTGYFTVRNFYIEYETSSGSQYQEFSTGALLKTFIENNKTTFINHCKVVAKLPEITDMSYMFNGCSSLTSIDLSNFDTSNVTDMEYMFGECESLTSIDVSNFDTSSVTSMSSMFDSCSNLTSIDISNFDTSSVTDMSYMFNGCSSLTSIDLSSFNTSNVTSMRYMFGGCSSLTSIDVSNFDTSNMTDMYYMFNGCSSLTSIDLSNFDTSNVTDMSRMFRNCSNLITLYCNDDWSNGVVSSSGGMFSGCASLVGAISYDSSKIDIAYANPTTGYFTVPGPTGVGKLLFNLEEFKKVVFEGVEYTKIVYEGEVLWSEKG